MRLKACAVLIAMFGMAPAANAATIIVYTNPMTLEQRTVVVATGGPDRAFMCMQPPADSGCIRIPVRRGR